MAKPKSKRKKRKVHASGIFITKLDKMRWQIQVLETQSLVENKRIERMKNAAAQMERLAAENKSHLEQYRTTLINLDRERKTFEQEYSKQRTNSLTALKNKTSDIDKLKTRFEVYRDARARDYKAAEAKEDKAKQEYESSKQLYDKAQKNYQTVQTHQQEIEKSFLELRNLESQIEKQRSHKNRYFLNEELKVLISKTGLKPYRTLAAELTKAFNMLNSARETLADKEVAFDRAKAEAESLRSELEMLDRTRREKILANLTSQA